LRRTGKPCGLRSRIDSPIVHYYQEFSEIAL
jgi:hypothetical protein